MKIRWILSLVLMLYSVIVSAELKEHTQIWLNQVFTIPVNCDSAWNYYIEPQERFIDDRYKFHRVALYLGILYKVNPTISLSAGAYRHYDLSSRGDVNQEYRLWQTINVVLVKNAKVTTSSRTRFDERERFQNPNHAYRVVQKFTILFPLPTTVSLSLSDASYWQFNKPDWVTDRTLAENRATIGLLIPINDKSSWEVGYLNQYLWTKPNQMGNTLYVTYRFG